MKLKKIIKFGLFVIFIGATSFITPLIKKDSPLKNLGTQSALADIPVDPSSIYEGVADCDAGDCDGF